MGPRGGQGARRRTRGHHRFRDSEPQPRRRNGGGGTTGVATVVNTTIRSSFAGRSRTCLRTRAAAEWLLADWAVAEWAESRGRDNIAQIAGAARGDDDSLTSH